MIFGKDEFVELTVSEVDRGGRFCALSMEKEGRTAGIVLLTGRQQVYADRFNSRQIPTATFLFFATPPP